MSVVSMVTSCHNDVYNTHEPLKRDVIQKASMILPDLNRINFDSWSHYVGHNIWLPLTTVDYKQLQQQSSFESYLTPERISDIVALQHGVFFNYSSCSTFLDVAQYQIMNSGRYLAKVEQNERYLVTVYHSMEQVHELLINMDMSVVACATNN